MLDIAGNLDRVRERLRSACERHGREPQSVHLVAVSKTFSAAAVAAAAAHGQRDFGENYIQEAVPKIATVADPGIAWHFIGPIQGNKTRAIAGQFDWAHCVERAEIAQRLSAQRPLALPPLNICVQVNISGEAAKAGCAPEQATALCASICRLPGLRLRGLMTVPAAAADAEAVRPAFAALRRLFERIRDSAAVETADFDTLSMGMSADFEVAIAEGATMVRIGTAIFGRRNAAGEQSSIL
jgi:pyridoxal phosphate enzyme (YggS family)